MFVLKQTYNEDITPKAPGVISFKMSIDNEYLQDLNQI